MDAGSGSSITLPNRAYWRLKVHNVRNDVGATLTALETLEAEPGLSKDGVRTVELMQASLEAAMGVLKSISDEINNRHSSKFGA